MGYWGKNKSYNSEIPTGTEKMMLMGLNKELTFHSLLGDNRGCFDSPSWVVSVGPSKELGFYAHSASIKLNKQRKAGLLSFLSILV